MNNHRQQGMVLLVSLMLLLMLTLIAIAASSQSTLQVRIASNSEMRNLAFQAAEAGITLARQEIVLKKTNDASLSGTLPGGQVYEASIAPSRFAIGEDMAMRDGFENRSYMTEIESFGGTGTGCTAAPNNNCIATAKHKQGVEYIDK